MFEADEEEGCDPQERRERGARSGAEEEGPKCVQGPASAAWGGGSDHGKTVFEAKGDFLHGGDATEA